MYLKIEKINPFTYEVCIDQYFSIKIFHYAKFTYLQLTLVRLCQYFCSIHTLNMKVNYFRQLPFLQIHYGEMSLTEFKKNDLSAGYKLKL